LAGRKDFNSPVRLRKTLRAMNTVTQLKTISGNTKSKVEAELSRTGPQKAF